MRKFICHTIHNCGDIIVNGDLEDEATSSGEQSSPPVPKTAKQLAARRNQERIKSILLLAIPDEYLLKFHNVPDAKGMLNINQKFLRSLPPSWSQIALIMKNKPDIDEVDIDDLYNNLRVYEDELKSTASGGFRVSSAGGINQVPTTPSAHDIAYSFLVQPTTSPQLENEDFQQMDGDDLEELDLRCQRLCATIVIENDILLENALVAQDGLGDYDWSNDFEVEPVNYAMMAISSSSSSSSSDSEENKKFNNLNLELEKVVKERDELKLKIKKWKRPSKNLTKILNSQMSTHDKNGLGFGTQMDDLSNKSETDSENRPDEYAFRNKIIKSKTTETNKTVGTTNEATIVKPKSVNETVVSKLKINRNEVIIEDWTSDDEDDVCADKTVSSVKPNVTQAVRSQADKSGQTSQKQGIGFKKVHKIKACFVCKSTSHLIKDCDFYDQKSPEPRVKNVVNTGKREVKPVWDYGKRVNHQNFSKNWKYPHAKRTFNPSAVLTRAGLVNTDRSNVSTARSISTVRPVYTVRPVSTARPLASKIAQSNSVIRPNHPRLDIVRPKASNSPIKRSYFTQPVYRPKDLKPDVKTFGVKNMTTVGTRAVVSKGKVENVLKKDKWVWRPKQMNLPGSCVQKIMASYMLKKCEYGNPEILLQDHAVVDSDCSSHMIGNKAYLSDYEDLNGGFAQEEEISPTILEAVKTLSKVASQGVSKEKSTDKGKRYRRRARFMAKKIDTGLDAEEDINTGREEVNTGIEEVSTGGTKVNSGTTSEKGQREGKALIVEEDIQATHKTKEQLRQEEAGLEEAIKLQAQLDEEVAKQIHLDKMVAQRMAEDEALSEQQKKRKAQLEANAELSKDVLGKDLPEQDFAKRMVDIVNQRKKHFAEERAKAKRNKPMTQSQLRIYMSNYLKNQGTWKLSQLKKLKFEEIKEEFDKYGEELQTKTSKKQKIEYVPKEKVEEPIKNIGKRKKQIARKGTHIDKSAKDEAEEEKEAFMKDKVKGASSESEKGIDAILTAMKPPNIVDWKIIPQLGLKCAYQIIRRDGFDKIYMSFGAILKDFSRDDLIELYRLVMKKYGENRPEEIYDRVLWGDLKTMFNPPLSDDAI
ncbi:hypothetical protein Tco_1406610 [Tanacetum coccineum]